MTQAAEYNEETGEFDIRDFTPAEEAERAQHEQVLMIAKRNSEIIAALEEIDRKTIRPLSEGETGRVAELRAEAAALRAQLVKV